MSCVTFHIIYIYIFFSVKVVELVGEGFVINGSSAPTGRLSKAFGSVEEVLP